jgi:hypothetical protein
MAEEKMEHNSECKSESHSEHLCYIVSQGFDLSEAERYKELVEDAEFKCQRCGRVAKSANNLCMPVGL